MQESLFDSHPKAAVTADYGRRVCEFVLDVEWTPEETRVTVLQPETVASRLNGREEIPGEEEE